MERRPPRAAAESGRSQRLLARLDRLRAGIERVGELMGDLAGWVYLLCACFITFEVISRRYFGFSSQGTTEISGYMLAFGITWGLWPTPWPPAPTSASTCC